MADNYYWSVVFHRTETRIPDYLVYLFNTKEEAIQSIRKRQVDCGLTLTDSDIYNLVEEELPISLDGTTVVSISLVKQPKL
jgi:hypothetical protein